MYKCTKCEATRPTLSGKCPCCSEWNCMVEMEIVKKVYKLNRTKKPSLKENKDELENWFDYQRKVGLQKPFCEECGRNISYQLNSEDGWIWKSSHAHIFPKKTFKSIMTNIHNHILLCKLCHGQYDSSWLNATKMKIWPTVVSRAKMIINLIKESTTKLPNELQNKSC